MKNKKWNLTLMILGIFFLAGVGFFVRKWNDPILWGLWFTAIGGTVTSFSTLNHLDKRQYIKNGVVTQPTK